MGQYDQILYDIELHNVAGIKHYFDDGGNPNDDINGEPLFNTMVEMYTRTPRFKDCIRAFIDAGLQFENEELLAVLTDDADWLHMLLKADKSIVHQSFSLFDNTYTPLTGATLMHFCAEYNCVNCAAVLLQYGADVNAHAAIDEYGFGGHTPVFHTVNQNNNNSRDMLNWLLAHGADLRITVKGLIWGRGYEWETFIPAVNPVSYCMMGLLPQMHRSEKVISDTVSLLLKHAYGIEYIPHNIPNAYLKS